MYGEGVKKVTVLTFCSCIAISGLGSHPFGSWKERDGQHMWLRDCLPDDLEGVRVLLYGYNTDLLDSQSFQDIDHIAANFAASINSIRQSYMVRKKRFSTFD